MTTVSFYTSTNGWQGFEAVGHANSAAYGEDLVCAAVSVLTQTAILGLQEVLGINCSLYSAEQAGVLACVLPQDLDAKSWADAQLVLQVLHTGLLAIVQEPEYRKYVSVKEVPYHENESSILRLEKRWRKHEKW